MNPPKSFTNIPVVDLARWQGSETEREALKIPSFLDLDRHIAERGAPHSTLEKRTLSYIEESLLVRGSLKYPFLSVVMADAGCNVCSNQHPFYSNPFD